MRRSRVVGLAGVALAAWFSMPPVASVADDVCVVANRATSDVGTLPRDTVVADLDGDGDLDLAIEDQTFVNILLNDGTGQLVEAPIANPASELYGITAADFDGDGDLDLAVTLGFDDRVGVMLNDGAASFGNWIEYDACVIPLGIDSGDVNGDDAPDIVVACGDYPGEVGVLINNGDGTFAPTVVMSTIGDRADEAVLLDIDGDLDLDLAVTNEQSASVALFANNGTGQFGVPMLLPVAPYPNHVTGADLDGQDGVDLIVASGEYFSPAGQLSVFFNDGQGAFDESSVYATPAGRCLHANAVDLNGDQAPDVLMSYAESSTGPAGLVAWHNDGAGLLSLVSDIDLPQTPYFVAGADMDGDSDADVVAVCDSARSIIVVENPGDGVFTQPQSLDGTFDHWVSADLDNDGHDDLIAPDEGLGPQVRGVHIQLNQGDGTFGPATTYDTLRYPDDLFAVDLDLDGDLDLVVGCAGFFNDIQWLTVDSGVSLLENHGDGSFSDPVNLLEGFNVWLKTVTVADFSGDLLPDVVAMRAVGVESAEVEYLINLGDFSFAEPVVITDQLGTVTDMLHSGDLDSDGDPELMVNLPFPDEHLWNIYANDYTYTFELRGTLDAGQEPIALVITDVEGDGIQDIVYLGSQYSDATLKIVRGRGDLSFDPPTALPVNNFAHRMMVADLNGDCAPDIVTSNGFTADISLYGNDGAGGFGDDFRSVPVGQGAGSMGLIDSDGDLRPELYVGYDFTRVLILEMCDMGLPEDCVPCEGDANGDGVVDPLDSGYVLARFGCEVGPGNEDCNRADQNHDGVVDPLDSGFVLARFGQCG